MKQKILQLRNVSIEIESVKGRISLLKNISLNIDDGRTLALVGESGCGKTICALSILGLLPRNIRLGNGEVWFKDRLIAQRNQYSGNDLRGKHIAMIFQQPAGALNPVFNVGTQINDVLHDNLGLTRNSAELRSNELLNLVGFDNPEEISRLYPHQLSGGMAQRVMIAMALGCRPELIIADEPTTALDVIAQAKILRLLKDLQSNFRFALLFITHNIRIIPVLADDVAVMHRGKIVEFSDAKTLLSYPQHEYSTSLLNSSSLNPLNKTKAVESVVTS